MSDRPDIDWADLDLLADFAAGLLTGPASERVAHLVATDPRWAALYQALGGAEPAVRDALHAAADVAELMPAAVTARVTTVLAPRPAPAPPTGTVWHRRRALVAVAAAVVLIGSAGGIASLGPLFGQSTDRSTNAESPAEGRPPSTYATPLPLTNPPATLFATGTDYRRDTLASVAGLSAGPRVSLDDPQIDAGGEFTPVDSSTGFVACLAVVREHYAGTVRVADFARFEGQPAVIMEIGQPPDALVIAVSPDCGRDGDLHELAAVELP